MMKHKERAAGDLQLSPNCRKALTVHLGEAAGCEVAELLQKMAERIERLEQSKVDVMPVVKAITSRGGSAAVSRRTA